MQRRLHVEGHALRALEIVAAVIGRGLQPLRRLGAFCLAILGRGWESTARWIGSATGGLVQAFRDAVITLAPLASAVAYAAGLFIGAVKGGLLGLNRAAMTAARAAAILMAGLGLVSQFAIAALGVLANAMRGPAKMVGSFARFALVAIIWPVVLAVKAVGFLVMAIAAPMVFALRCFGVFGTRLMQKGNILARRLGALFLVGLVPLVDGFRMLASAVGRAVPPVLVGMRFLTSFLMRGISAVHQMVSGLGNLAAWLAAVPGTVPMPLRLMLIATAAVGVLYANRALVLELVPWGRVDALIAFLVAVL
jgi:hypothetical protein